MAQVRRDEMIHAEWARLAPLPPTERGDVGYPAGNTLAEKIGPALFRWPPDPAGGARTPGCDTPREARRRREVRLKAGEHRPLARLFCHG
jgi:hypothetical protein